MPITLLPVNSKSELLQFVKLPWSIYKGDPFWVPPLIDEMLERLTKGKNAFWETSDNQCWIAFQDGIAAGRICTIAEKSGSPHHDPALGKFGFFESINDQTVANLLFETAAEWLNQRGFSIMRGPYNPSPNDEVGVMMEGFHVRPVILTGHTPEYYPQLFTQNGMVKYRDMYARRYIRPDGITFNDAFPSKLQRVAKIASIRSDIHLRVMNMKRWEDEVNIACEIYNQALACLPGFNPVPFDEFLQLSNTFKPFLDPSMAVIAEIDGKPVGYALALPDVNEALQKANGKLDLIGTTRFLLAMHRLHRVSFKILMMLPEYQARGIETLLIQAVAKRIWEKGYREVDMSLAGDENEKSNRFQTNLGFKVYLTYRVYEKPLRRIP